MFHGLWKFPHHNILTPAPSIAGNSVLPLLPKVCFCACVCEEERVSECLHMCMQVNMCQSLRGAEAAAALPVALSASGSPKASRQKMPNKFTFLASCKLEANCQNKNADKILK